MGITPFSDLTPAEFRALYLTPELNEIVKMQNSSASFVRLSRKDPPPSIDWRTKGVVPPVEDQGQSGEVILFVGADNVASATALVHPPLIPGGLANIRNMVSVCSNCKPQADFPCMYAYAVKNGLCTNFGKDCKCTPDLHFSSYKSLKDESNLLLAVADGPVSAYVNAIPWQTYQSGILSGNCSSQVDHAALVVGYGTDRGQDYWVLKNSWGTSWGEQGYIRLKRSKSGAGICGVAVGDFYPIAK